MKGGLLQSPWNRERGSHSWHCSDFCLTNNGCYGNDGAHDGDNEGNAPNHCREEYPRCLHCCYYFFHYLGEAA